MKVQNKIYNAKLPSIATSRIGWISQSKVGTGHFSDVYKVDYEYGTFAFKVLNEDRSKEVENASILEREVHIYEAIGEHPNIVKCYGMLNDRMFEERGIALEYLQNGTLDTLSKRLEVAYDLDRITSMQLYAILQHIIGGIINAVLHIESQGYVHNDTKAENIGFDSSYTPKLYDLGCAHRVGRVYVGSNLPPIQEIAYITLNYNGGFLSIKTLELFDKYKNLFKNIYLYKYAKFVTYLNNMLLKKPKTLKELVNHSFLTEKVLEQEVICESLRKVSIGRPCLR